MKEAQILKYQNANLRVQGHATYLRMRCMKHMWDYDAVLAELTKLTLTDIQVIFPPSTSLAPEQRGCKPYPSS